MKAVKHTPGPWETDSNGKVWGDIDNEALDGDSPLLAEMFGNGAEQRANGKLIEAAPDLLKVCQEMESLLRIENPAHRGNPKAHEAACKAHRIKMQAAVAKATKLD